MIHSIYTYIKSLLFILTSVSIIWAKNIEWSANLRYRIKTDTNESVEQGNISSFSEMRSRMGLRLLSNKVTGQFILQDSRVLGALDNKSGITNTTVSAFFHQAYFNLKLYNAELQIGRFELALGNQRIIAKNNWNNIGLSLIHISSPRDRGRSRMKSSA